VDLSGVSKRYILRKQRPFLLREVVRRLLGGRPRHEQFWALRSVTLEVRRGESVAIIGGNGAGKSTLLGVVAGAVAPTLGVVRVAGRIGALLELGAGFHPDLTGRENVYLNASLLGLTKEEVEEQFADILAFSELHDFIDVQLRNYSSGMHVRLGFSVAAHVSPDILLMDEALSVGDQSFQHKCIDRILRFRDEGKTLLFVSHSPDLVRLLCRRVVWLDHGRVRMDGPTDPVLEGYLQASA
jgi:ABC-type polysaccharide/polyol phosphate transport system ATPase subunit